MKKNGFLFFRNVVLYNRIRVIIPRRHAGGNENQRMLCRHDGQFFQQDVLWQIG
jgi:hypothetical protein